MNRKTITIRAIKSQASKKGDILSFSVESAEATERGRPGDFAENGLTLEKTPA